MDRKNLPTSESGGPLLQSPKSSTKPEVVQMKKQLGLLEGVAIILGIIFGSGESEKLHSFKFIIFGGSEH